MKNRLFYLVYIFVIPLSVEAFQLQDERVIYETWIDIVEQAHQSHTESDPMVYTVIAENFFNQYVETGELSYLIFAIHEAGRTLREEILGRLNESDYQKISMFIDKLEHRKFSSELYKVREFSPDDIYLFHVLSIPDEFRDEAVQLLDHWLDHLPDLYETNALKAAFMAQTLTIGYTKAREFGKVVALSNDLIADKIMPASLFTLNIYELMIYPLYIRGEYSILLNLFEEALLPDAVELKDEAEYANLRMDYASTLFLIGKLGDALAVYESILNETPDIEEFSFYTVLLNNIGLSYLLLGESGEYIKYQLISYQIASESKDYPNQIETLRNLSFHHQFQNDLPLAYDYLTQAIEIANTQNIMQELPRLLIDKAIFVRDFENNISGALQNFHEALQIQKINEDYFIVRTIYQNLATTYDLLNEKESAENYFVKSIEISFEREDPAGQLSSTLQYAEWLIKENRHNEALSWMREYLDLNIDGFAFSTRVQFRNVETKLLIHQGDISGAFELASNNLDDVLDWMLQSSDQQTGHMQISSVFAETIRLNTVLQQMNGNYREALAISGKVRHISRSGFYNNPALKSSLLSQEELIQDYNLGTRIQQLRNMYTNANNQQRSRIRTELTNSMSERNRLVNQAFPRYIESQYEELLRHPRRLLKNDELVIYFSRYENQLFQFFITRSGVDMIAYPDERKFYQIIDDAIATFGYRSTDLKLMHELYKTFFEGKIPSGISHIYIVPDGDLYRIPFEILPVEPVDTPFSFGAANYFIENYSVSYLNTLSDLKKEQRGSNGYFETDIAGFGISNFSEAGHRQLTDLPFSPIEVVNSINNLTHLGKHQMFIEQQSTESNFKNTAGNSRIIHLATHSRVVDNNPLFSSFYLYNDQYVADLNTNPNPNRNNSDGIVRAYEIFDLNLDADLVFLSSCESGSGGYLQGTGILGFSRAFSYAGAKSLVLNLWPVRDQTSAEITPRFYDYLNNGMNKAEAIQQTKINYMNHRDSDPYLWGSFVIYGNTDPIIDQQNFAIQLIVAALSLLGLFILASFIRKLMRI